MELEPNVGKKEIWILASQHADEGDQTPTRNPYPDGTRAHSTYELYFWERMMWLNGESSA